MMKGKFAKTSKVSKYYETDCRQNHEQKGEKKKRKNFRWEQELIKGLINWVLDFISRGDFICISRGYFEEYSWFMIADGRAVETEDLKKVLDAISKIKKKK